MWSKGGGFSGDAGHPQSPTPSLSAPHTRDRAQRRQGTKTATVAQYILHIVNTHGEVAMKDFLTLNTLVTLFTT